jgi:hypothetical protein
MYLCRPEERESLSIRNLNISLIFVHLKGSLHCLGLGRKGLRLYKSSDLIGGGVLPEDFNPAAAARFAEVTYSPRYVANKNSALRQRGGGVSPIPSLTNQWPALFSQHRKPVAGASAK